MGSRAIHFNECLETVYRILSESQVKSWRDKSVKWNCTLAVSLIYHCIFTHAESLSHRTICNVFVCLDIHTHTHTSPCAVAHQSSHCIASRTRTRNALPARYARLRDCMLNNATMCVALITAVSLAFWKITKRPQNKAIFFNWISFPAHCAQNAMQNASNQMHDSIKQCCVRAMAMRIYDISIEIYCNYCLVLQQRQHVQHTHTQTASACVWMAALMCRSGRRKTDTNRNRLAGPRIHANNT